MMQARYPPEQLRQLDQARYCQKTDAINRRVNAVYFYGTGQLRCEAARLAGVCPNTRRKFAAAYESDGLAAVVADAATRGIDLLFLLSYSPNLNLIERLWKFINKDCLNGRYYRTHQQFQAAILDSLDAVNTRHQPTVKTTLTLNFQMFDNAQLLTV